MGSTRSFVQSIDYICKKRQNHPIFGQISFIQTIPSNKLFTTKIIKLSKLQLPKFITQLIPNNSPLNPSIPIPTSLSSQNQYQRIHYLQIYKIDNSQQSLLTSCSYGSMCTLYLPSIQKDLQSIMYENNMCFDQKQLINLMICVLDGVLMLNRMKIGVMPINKKTVILKIQNQNQRDRNGRKDKRKGLSKGIQIQIGKDKRGLDNACWMVVPLCLGNYQMWNNNQGTSPKNMCRSPQHHIKQLGLLILQIINDQSLHTNNKHILLNNNIKTNYDQNYLTQQTQQNPQQINKYKQILSLSNLSNQLKQIIMSMIGQQQKNRIGLTSLLDICTKLKNRNRNDNMGMSLYLGGIGIGINEDLIMRNIGGMSNVRNSNSEIKDNKQNKEKQSIRFGCVSQQSRLRGLSGRKTMENSGRKRSISITQLKQTNIKQQTNNTLNSIQTFQQKYGINKNMIHHNIGNFNNNNITNNCMFSQQINNKQNININNYVQKNTNTYSYNINNNINNIMGRYSLTPNISFQNLNNIESYTVTPLKDNNNNKTTNPQILYKQPQNMNKSKPITIPIPITQQLPNLNIKKSQSQQYNSNNNNNQQQKQQNKIKPKNTTKYQRIKFKNGAFYQGQIDQNNRFNGFGTLYYSQDKICYAGYWKNNCFNGFGYLYNQEINLKEKQNLKNIQVNYHNFTIMDMLSNTNTQPHQNIIQSKQNSRISQFSHTNTNTTTNISQNSTNKSQSKQLKAQLQKLWQRYQGQFKNDLKHGYGILYFIDGSKFEGQFIKGKAYGTGSFMGKYGKIVDGVWKDNKLVKQY